MNSMKNPLTIFIAKGLKHLFLTEISNNCKSKIKVMIELIIENPPVGIPGNTITIEPITSPIIAANVILL